MLNQTQINTNRRATMAGNSNRNLFEIFEHHRNGSQSGAAKNNMLLNVGLLALILFSACGYMMATQNDAPATRDTGNAGVMWGVLGILGATAGWLALRNPASTLTPPAPAP